MAKVVSLAAARAAKAELGRTRVVAAARAWLGTPFHDDAMVKGVGVDCARLLAATYAEAGIIEPPRIEPYSPQWFLHSDTPLFEQYVRRYAHEVEAPEPGDVVLYRYGRSFAHGGVVVAWPGAVIHAFKPYGRVVETGGEESGLAGRPRKFFSFW